MGIFDRFKAPAAAGPLQPNEPGVPVNVPAKVPAKHQTPADVLDYWCAKHKATYERSVGDGFVRIRVHLPTGDTLAGNGPTTRDAVAVVVRKLEAL